jgi:hypothetical protein
LAERRIDLHAHTVVSDGTLTPTQLVELAAQKGLAAIALTDHDHLGGLEEARRAGERLGVEIVPGIELSANLAPHKADIHLLAYLVDPAHLELAARLERFREVRARRGVLIVEKLRALGVDLTMEDVARAAGPGAGSIGRPHVARALMEKRLVSSVQEAFERWLGEGRPAYVEKEKLDAREGIALVHAAGGVAVLAHPGLLPQESRYAILRALAAVGLDGVEVEHSRHSSDERRTLRKLAQELSLVETGGSDFHGENKPDVQLGYGVGGNVHVTMRTLSALRERAAAARR